MDRKYVGHSDDYDFNDKVKELLLFHKIVKVTQIDSMEAVFVLDNGVELTTIGNEGCGGCGNGWYDINEHWRIRLTGKMKLAGMFHLNAHYYGAELSAGAEYRF